ncbi:hypothetical protein CSKR_107650 [Clonorchis sinensis]|uniref:Uncharacterized protein n=1 Tax=Clonorchis sinensis TaxID=79923 RepID=A0A419PTI5_CLOSI|nr:hypothetical protein CSKR_107650 [Clonorchis sinensis]
MAAVSISWDSEIPQCSKVENPMLSFVFLGTQKWLFHQDFFSKMISHMVVALNKQGAFAVTYKGPLLIDDCGLKLMNSPLFEMTRIMRLTQLGGFRSVFALNSDTFALCMANSMYSGFQREIIGDSRCIPILEYILQPGIAVGPSNRPLEANKPQLLLRIRYFVSGAVLVSRLPSEDDLTQFPYIKMAAVA